MSKQVKQSMKLITTAFAVLGLMMGAGSAQLNSAKSTIAAGNQEGARSQAQINNLDDQRDGIEANFRQKLEELSAAKVYNEQLRLLIAKQEQDITLLSSQIDSIANLDRDIVPIMIEMVDSLEEFIALDLPFLPDERAALLERIRKLFEDPNSNPAQRYRVVMNAYQIENEYGRTIEAYEAELDDGTGRKVTFLRVGRVALYYQTEDQNETGLYNPETKSFDILDSGFNQPIRTAIKMAREILPPNMLELPLRYAADE